MKKLLAIAILLVTLSVGCAPLLTNNVDMGDNYGQVNQGAIVLGVQL